ncbi:alanine--tRNA ligase [Candidatus Shapirobacteria bacterium CG10_big_fil_rev_8_21_14_0_10_40_9]|uniref:Alanine--tRNA ligase n=1 Tax=Candidatus Shapirobacteria bacterium CG10_big_fil_rev_8_21_14_0_10_40_9 TaxID=1974888 RepID=A0A2M8L4N7_9BACT|nr:MAG: alanine--tRNA ligase [Candidatus Shapirobacteria bacterium CG10_big_fil_rev_8_21_14_0_10_40_9]
MTAKELRKKFLDFFVKKGHKVIPNVSLIPENDPTTLFISAGMHPLVPYLLGEPHPQGKRLCSIQKCLRTDDIDSVGDSFHHTFFEMLGNWSLGDYWKKEAIEWSWELLTKILQLDPKKIYISCFGGDKDAPRDEESARIWQEVGIPKEKIYFYGKKENWWGPAGKTGPCGPDTEMFYDTTGKPCGPKCHPNDNCGRFFEIWNDVFMEYEKTGEGKFKPLKQKNVDTGMGVERTVAVLSGLDDDYQTELFRPIIQSIEVLSGKSYKDEENKKPMRIIADHLRAAAFIITDGVTPSNVEQGYVLRRLIRRAIRFGKLIKVFTPEVAGTVIQTMREEYPELEKKKELILETLTLEEEKFKKTLERGLKEIEKYKKLDGRLAFYLYETYGFPLEMTGEIAVERGQKIDKKAFEEEFKRHQEISRAGAEKKFAGGLADHSEIATKYHTATHLLNAALRQVLGPHVEQKGSNITSERLRFDFPNAQKLTEEQLKNTEKLVNEVIERNLAVTMEVMDFNKAVKKGALTVPGEKYPEKVKVYSIGDFSLEVCGGPHVDFTGKLGKFKIIKEEGAGAGIRRIYAILE